MLGTVLAFGCDVLMLFLLFTACGHLNEIADRARELTSLNFHLSEIRRRMHTLERCVASSRRRPTETPVVETTVEKKDD